MQRKVLQIIHQKLNASTRRNYSNLIEDDFRVLSLRPMQQRNQTSRKQRKFDYIPPRTNKMSENQDWNVVWPGPRSFHPASVPLPLRQGFNPKSAPPSKFANAELIKIPNFLHLTPLAIKKQCEALKQFCTPWPMELNNEKQWENHFPIETVSSDYCHGLPTIRDPLARIVTIKIKLKSLKFDTHSKDKFLRLVGEHYNPNTDVITISSDRCPVKQQNYNFCLYILTASYFESYIYEPWEDLKLGKDMIRYEFRSNKSKETIEKIIKSIENTNPIVVPNITVELVSSIEQLQNEIECNDNLDTYKKEVKKLLGL